MAEQLLCICGDPVYNGKTIHDCCAHYGPSCPACASSRSAAAEWLRVSKVCPGCQRRSRFTGRLCPVCVRARADDDESATLDEPMTADGGTP